MGLLGAAAEPFLPRNRLDGGPAYPDALPPSTPSAASPSRAAPRGGERLSGTASGLGPTEQSRSVGARGVRGDPGDPNDSDFDLDLDPDHDSTGLPRPSTSPVAPSVPFWQRLFPRSTTGPSVGRTIAPLEGYGRKHGTYARNVVCNQKYNVFTFFPLVLYEQFKFFFNLYFLLVALSQFIPALKIGFLVTYIAPLSFVLAVTIGKEALDDVGRYRRDAESNSQPYKTLLPARLVPRSARRAALRRHARTHSTGVQLPPDGDEDHAAFLTVPSSALKVGDLIVLEKNDRVPADVLLLRTASGDHHHASFPASPDPSQSTAAQVPQQSSLPGDQELQFAIDDELAQMDDASAAVPTDSIPQAREDEGPEGRDANPVAMAEEEVAEEDRLGGHEAGGEGSESGSCFIRTDQLDGETDWKLRIAVECTQSMSNDELVSMTDRASLYAGPPIKDIHTFVGNFTLHSDQDASDAASINNLQETSHAHGHHRATNDHHHHHHPHHLLLPGREGNEDVEASAARQPRNEPDRPGSTIAMAPHPQMVPLTAENMLWANTVLAAGCVVGMVVYTGSETRAVMNTSHPETKVGLLDLEINRLSKILACVTFTLSISLVAFNGFRGEWWVYIFRFLILFSSIIPISLRVNLDMGKTVYGRQIMSDEEIPGTVVRTSTLPEELGRIEYLLSDKTGTLTQNEMELRKLHLGTMSYGFDAFDEVATQLEHALALDESPTLAGGKAGMTGTTGKTGKTSSKAAQKQQDRSLSGGGMLYVPRARRDMSQRVKDLALALALCHNVTPVIEEEEEERSGLIEAEGDGDGSGTGDRDGNGNRNGSSDRDTGQGDRPQITYQASSPDEVAIVRWTESIGLTLVYRDRTSLVLRASCNGQLYRFRILEIFPFSSESKRMGIVIRDERSGEVTFYQKGADVVMTKIVAENDWLDEETGNMAREGLRTLVIGRKKLSPEAWADFEQAYKQARLRLEDRNEAMATIVSQHLEYQLELLGLTGVEDKLQTGVKATLELLRNAGIKIWMLTGDKIETATCIAISSKLVARNQYIHTVQKLPHLQAARDALSILRTKLDCCLVIDGDSLHQLLSPQHPQLATEFIEVATQLSAVVACRCSPQQKADVARLIKEFTQKRVCCIGDGGNDVAMIQAANVGLGIVGKEGKQASLAADFSLTQFAHLTRLLVWHGRNSYKRSAKLAQFVIHRGLIISVMQAVFSAIFYFAPIALYQGWLMVGYATVYTMAPVFSLVLDRDVSEDMSLLYPELYKDLTKGRSLSSKTFTEWLMVSIYQGGAIMIASLALFENEFLNIVSISFTALVFNELIMVALEITTWHLYMVISEVATMALYCISIVFLPEFFDLRFVLTRQFFWKVALIVAISSFPLYALKALKRRWAPPSYSKLAMA